MACVRDVVVLRLRYHNQNRVPHDSSQHDAATGKRMTSMIAVPLWLLMLLGVLAACALLEWLLLPGIRWYFRRKMMKAIEDVNTRFNIQIPQFKLTRRQVLIDRLCHDAKV